MQNSSSRLGTRLSFVSVTLNAQYLHLLETVCLQQRQTEQWKPAPRGDNHNKVIRKQADMSAVLMKCKSLAGHRVLNLEMKKVCPVPASCASVCLQLHFHTYRVQAFIWQFVLQTRFGIIWISASSVPEACEENKLVCLLRGFLHSDLKHRRWWNGLILLLADPTSACCCFRCLRPLD